MSTLSAIEFTLVIEQNHPPTQWVLNKSTAKTLSHAIALQLAHLYPEIKALKLIVAAGLYDLADILRPQFPVHQTLHQSLIQISQGKDFIPEVIALSSETPEFSLQTLTPSTQRTSPLAIIPCVLLGEDIIISALQNEIESTLMQQPVSNALQQVITTAFKAQYTGISFASLADVCGLLAGQLIQMGLEPLWSIIQGALFSQPTPLVKQLPSGHYLYWSGQAVYLFSPMEKYYNQTTLNLNIPDWQTYHAMNEHFQHLFCQYHIPCVHLLVPETNFFKQTPSIQHVQQLITQHIKEL